MIANDLLEYDMTVGPGEDVSFSNPANDASLVIWLAPSGLSAFDEDDPTQSRAAGDATSMKAPTEPGVYMRTVVDADGRILSQSDAKVTVE